MLFPSILFHIDLLIHLFRNIIPIYLIDYNTISKFLIEFMLGECMKENTYSKLLNVYNFV